MCRLYGFIANEPTKVDCSLVFAQNALMIQSRVDERGAFHSDGWGIATYEDGTPKVERRTSAAFEDQVFSSTAERIYSKVIIAHVRKATVGKNSVHNTHPFVSGHWIFAHNGTVTGFDSLAPQLAAETDAALQAQRVGQTDSEQYFLWLLTQLQSQEEQEDCQAIAKRLHRAVGKLAERCHQADPDNTPRLNFVLTNGEVMYACRWNNSLHIIRREGVYDCEICGIPHIHRLETVNHRAVVLASEPVTHEQWNEVENESVLAFDLAKHTPPV